MKLNIKEKQYICNKKDCRKKLSVFKNTFFENCNIMIKYCFQILYLYLRKTPITEIVDGTKQSTKTVVSWCRKLRNFLAEKITLKENKIGGYGIVVEIDETKLGKRKYNRGHHVEGACIICGVERTQEKRYFAIQVDKRDSITIKKILKIVLLKVQLFILIVGKHI